MIQKNEGNKITLKNQSQITDEQELTEDLSYEIEVLKSILELCLVYPKDLLKNDKGFSKSLKDILISDIKLNKSKDEKNKKVISFLQGLVIFYFNSAWGIGKGLVRSCILDSSLKKVRVILIGQKKIEFKKGEYDKGTDEIFSLVKKILWNKDISKDDGLNLRDITEIKKVLMQNYDNLKHNQKQLLKISQNPNEIIKSLENINNNVMPVFIFFACLPEINMEELFNYVGNHLPPNYEDTLPDGKKFSVSNYFSGKSNNISDCFEKIRILLFLYNQSKHKIIEEIVKIKTKDYLINLFKNENIRDVIIKTILDTVEGQFNPRIQLINLFSKIL